MKRMIDGVPMTVHREQINLACLVNAECGTTGPQGGDSGHGCRTYIRIADAGGVDVIKADLRRDVIAENEHIKERNNGTLEIILGGDAELQAVIEVCEFIARTLREQAMEGKA